MQPSNPSQHAIGIDASRYQGEIDWAAVRSSGISFAFLKATEGTTITDEYFASYTDGAKQNGLLVGAYHFCRAKSVDEARAEAAYFLQALQNNGGPGRFELPLVLDIETDNGLDRQTLTDVARTFLEEVRQSTGRGPLLYTYPYFADTYLDASLGVYPLWLANYGNSQPSDVAGWTHWTFLQYTDRGTVAGIGGTVDMNEYDGTEEELKANMATYQLSAEDANYIIERWLAHEYDLASDADQATRHRLANELRQASGQEPQA